MGGLVVVTGLQGLERAAAHDGHELAEERDVVVGVVEPGALLDGLGLEGVVHLAETLLVHEAVFAREDRLVRHGGLTLVGLDAREGAREVNGHLVARAGVALAQVARDVVNAVGKVFIELGIGGEVLAGHGLYLLGGKRHPEKACKRLIESGAALKGSGNFLGDTGRSLLSLCGGVGGGGLGLGI